MFRELLNCKHILLLLTIFILKPSSSSDLSPDSKRLYHDIVSGHGLYYGFPKLTELGGNNFKNVVYNEQKHKLWLVEFYNSWCGHCHRFAPTWKTLASDVYDWRDVVALGAVDCANDANNQLCRDMEVMYYPMIKLFPPNSDEKFLGEDFQKGKLEEMRKNLVDKLKAYHKGHNTVGAINLKPLTDSSLDSLWDNIPSDVSYLILVFEPEDSVIGSELALDLSQTMKVRVRLVNPSNEGLPQAVNIEHGSNDVVIIERDMKYTDLKISNHTRPGLNKAVRHFLVNNGVDIPPELPPRDAIIAPEVDIGEVMRIMQLEEEIKKKLQTTSLSTVVFQLDLEGAIRYSLKNEVPLHRNITGEKLTALKNYVTVLVKYFPFGHQGVEFMKKLKEEMLDDKNEVAGKAFKNAFNRLEDQYKPFLKKQGWLGCRGSQPELRGYPCSLWTTFHTLTVQEEAKSDEAPEVLHAMAGYIKNFFSCSECAGHFTEMAKTITGNVSTHNDSILWLWAAHNNANKRLAGDATEDPKHKKIQFPGAESCSSCYNIDGSWNKSEVLNFLKNMYSNIVYLQLDDVTPKPSTESSASPAKYDKSLRHEIYGDEQGYKHKQVDVSSKSSWDFNVFDISLCVMLYVCSVAILILVCIKFVFKRSYRKKPYIHDILSKV